MNRQKALSAEARRKTILSTALILLCTSMAAWYIARVNSLFCKALYFLCVFSMVVPFQMVMFTLSKTANTLHLNTPWTIPIIYLGFGAGLAIFMFVGFVKSIPLEIEEAAAIDGCGPMRTYFSVVVPMLKPTTASVRSGIRPYRGIHRKDMLSEQNIHGSRLMKLCQRRAGKIESGSYPAGMFPGMERR